MRAGRGPESPLVQARAFCGEAYPEPEAVLQGARDILAETLAETAEWRELGRVALRGGLLVARLARGHKRESPEDAHVRAYFEFPQPVKKTRPHHYLDLMRR